MILAVAALARLWGLAAGDLTGSDEIFYGFRAIGMLDYDNAPKQSTPLEWFDPINAANKIIPYPPSVQEQCAKEKNAVTKLLDLITGHCNQNQKLTAGIPWWTNLSFHDHPPLVFLVQHWSIKVFGENKFAFRLPSALAGILSVYLIYLIGKKLFSEKAGLLSAALMAITVNAVHNSRLGLQESTLMALILAAIYFFLLAKDNKRNFILAGVFFGLALLAKYNAIILLPIFLTYILFFHRDWLKEKYLWLGLAAAVVIFSPVIIYNLELYRATGHFDFQLSYLFGQNPPIWQSAPGKEEAGTLTNRLLNFLPNLAKANSWLFLVVAAASLCRLAYGAIKKRLPSEIFLLAANVWFGLLIVLAVGPAFRFLAMLTPFFALAVGYWLSLTWPISSRLMTIALAIFIAWEALYTANTDLVPYPIGPQHFAFSRLRYENYRWGYNALDQFLEKELSGKYPAFVLNQKYGFLDEMINNSIESAKTGGSQPYSALIIYDNNLKDAAKFWSLDRLQIYHGWPVVKTEGFLELQTFDLPAHTTYFIIPAGKVPLKKPENLTTIGAQFEQKLLAKGIFPIAIKNQRDEVVFRIYKF